jgi:hypothetical protein
MWFKKSLMILKGGNQNLYIEEEQTTVPIDLKLYRQLSLVEQELLTLPEHPRF